MRALFRFIRVCITDSVAAQQKPYNSSSCAPSSDSDAGTHTFNISVRVAGFGKCESDSWHMLMACSTSLLVPVV